MLLFPTLFLLLEFLIIPGVTVFGIGGFLFLILGIGSSYYFHGIQTGNYTLLGTVLLSFITIYFIFKQKTWQKIGLKANITSRNEPFEVDKIHLGDSGKTLTRLGPIGKVMINDVVCEAKSEGGFINENTKIEVIKVLNTQIIVKPKN